MNRDSHSEPKLKTRLRAETARVIAAAAEEVFAAKGLHDAKVEEIAARAGVSVGTAYNHFEDRDGLLQVLIEGRRQQLAIRLDAVLDEVKSEPFPLQLRRFATTVLEHFEAHREFLAITLQCDSASLAQPSEAMREVKARVEALVRRGVEQRALRALGQELWATLLLGSVRAVLVHELRNPGRLPVGERASAIVDFFLYGAGA